MDLQRRRIWDSIRDECINYKESQMATIVKELNKAIKAVALRQKTAKNNVRVEVLRSVFKAIAQETGASRGMSGSFFWRYRDHLEAKKARKSITDKKRYYRNKKKKR